MSHRLAHAHQTKTPVIIKYNRNRIAALVRSVVSVVLRQVPRVHANRRTRLAARTAMAIRTKAVNKYMLLFITAC